MPEQLSKRFAEGFAEHGSFGGELRLERRPGSGIGKVFSRSPRLREMGRIIMAGEATSPTPRIGNKRLSDWRRKQ
jgi:hypothetical protein